MKNEIIEKSVNYIDMHIIERLDISELAKLAGYSQVQFVRNFTELTGFTPSQYISRRKLYFAAKDLINTNLKITDIAMKYEFTSHDSFTRAFKGIYHITPEFFRRKGFHVPEFIRPIDENESNPLFKCVEIVTLPEIKLIGIARKFRASEQAWEVFNRMYDSVFKNAPNRVYPNSHNVTHNLSILQPNGDFTIFSGIEVTNFNNVPKGVDIYTLPEQEHAMLCFEGGLDYRECTDFLYLKWIGKSNYQSGQTKDYPIATVEYYSPNEIEPYKEAVYIPILPVIAVKETLQPCRAYSYICESKDNFCIGKHAVEKTLSLIPKPVESRIDLRVKINQNVCETFFITNDIIVHPDLYEKRLEGGNYLKVETSSRCPHVAQRVFQQILSAKKITADEQFEEYTVTDGAIGELTPMQLYCKVQG